MKEIRMFLASSIVEFKEIRQKISSLIYKINNVLLDYDCFIYLCKSESTSNIVVFGGKQKEFDDFIKDCDIFVGIIGSSIGQYTMHEIEIAEKNLQKGNILILTKMGINKELDFVGNISCYLNDIEIQKNIVNFISKFIKEVEIKFIDSQIIQIGNNKITLR